MKYLLIISFIAVFLCILFYSSQKKDTDNTTNKTIHDTKNKSNAKTKDTDEPIETTLIATSTPTEIIESTPIVDGIKERQGILSMEDELYLAEFVDTPEKAPSLEPILKRPKQPFFKWVLQFSGSVAGGIAIEKNHLYFGTYDYQAFGVRAATGKVIFRVKTISQPVNTTHISGDLFLVPQRNGQVTAFQTKDGAIKWNHRSAVDKPEEPIDLSISCISLFEKSFYVSKHWGNLYIASLDSGILTQDVGVTYESRINLPAIKTKNGVLFSNVAGEVHCFKDSGEKNWDYTLPKGYATALCKRGNILYIATTEKEFIGLDLNTREVLWTQKLTGFAFDSIAVMNHHVIVQAKDLLAINPNTGAILWTIQAKSEEGFCRGKPVMKDDSLYATEQNGRIIKANLNDGSIQKEFFLNETIRSPITANNDLIFIPTLQKKVYALALEMF